jgi:photosystem II stability/assembly factor-like uncharacterized protein
MGSTVTTLVAVGSARLAIVGVDDWRRPLADEVPRLFASRDFLHWREISSALPVGYEIQSVSFPDPNTGWIAGCNPGVECRILRTTDGGSSWQEIRSLNSVSSTVQVVLSALSAGVVWMEVFQLAAGVTDLQGTDSGGQTWIQRSAPGSWPAPALVEFGSDQVGFADQGLPPANFLPTGVPLGSPFYGELLRSTDGGTSWQEAALPRPPDQPGGVMTYDGLPTFLDRNSGVEAVASYTGSTSRVSFYTTTDAGSSWVFDASIRTCSEASNGMVNSFPAVSIASRGTWWVVSSCHDVKKVSITTDDGKRWALVPASKFGGDVAELLAKDGSTAFVLTSDGTGCNLLRTSDRGKRWVDACPPSSATAVVPTSATSSPNTSAQACASSQLTVELGLAGAAMGHVGSVVSFKNISNATCTLDGYPGLKMLDEAGHPIPTEVTDGIAYTVPSIPEQTVTLAPEAVASFELGFSDSTGYGTASCPTSAKVEITPSSSDQPITVSWQIQPYGGRSIQQLHCGEVTVSPVYAGGGQFHSSAG